MVYNNLYITSIKMVMTGGWFIIVLPIISFRWWLKKTKTLTGNWDDLLWTYTCVWSLHRLAPFAGMILCAGCNYRPSGDFRGCVPARTPMTGGMGSLGSMDGDCGAKGDCPIFRDFARNFVPIQAASSHTALFLGAKRTSHHCGTWSFVKRSPW